MTHTLEMSASAVKEAIAGTLDTTLLGRPLVVFDKVASTSDVVRDWAAERAPEGSTAIALSQTKGRGRQGRTWHSAPGEGLYMSILLRPPFTPGEAGWLAIVAAVAVLRAVERLGVKQVSIKGPNDILVRGRKIAGILVEPRIGHDRMDFAVLGIGLNISQRRTSWSEPLKRVATSCLMEGVHTTIEEAARYVLTELDACYSHLLSGACVDLLSEWTSKGASADCLPDIF